ncbi:small GTPase Rhoa putative [Entamoeba histolytica]|uniref:small monomeric GTPase n=3 Tax=Entamoeba histolytica TaxID=5759 RepID=C4M3D7_ENTH1|nr:small GTPase RhoA, putative [Entamoeba histolytica HM-1:IMSS]EAL51737.1 small GTPase RhoA, putative [Entamoeba histolytica HM-1:IMSS]EMD46733.1 small GTPase RhoA, putative [Entamoeba histolytica KU27]GAT95824.1 small GTPase Rhoa putative [Entamoeba histolytica]|eukprot:XP_657120.1 small GTPase RhoA, putative [Entamoeba histolytica HM-1:IMSS]
MTEKESISQINIVVLGDSKAGKTSLLITYRDGKFPRDYIPIMFDGVELDKTYREKEYHVVIKDSSGFEDYECLRKILYMNANFFVICYSIDKPDSLKRVESTWVPEIQHQNSNAPIILVGTKKDLRKKKNRQETIEEEEGYDVARRIKCRFYIETSALHKEGITELFNGIFEMFRAQEKPKKNKKEKCIIC